MRLLLLAPPGAGKGTQGQLLAAHFGVRHISSGDLLRAHLTDGTPLGQQVARYLAAGDLVPDELVEDLLLAAVLQAAEAGGYVLDGFPRTVHQAQQAYLVARQQQAQVQAVLLLDVPDPVLTRRLAARGRGTDDTEATIGHRLAVYHAQTEPLVAYYRQRGILHVIDGDAPIPAVTAACLAALDTVAA